MTKSSPALVILAYVAIAPVLLPAWLFALVCASVFDLSIHVLFPNRQKLDRALIDWNRMSHNSDGLYDRTILLEEVRDWLKQNKIKYFHDIESIRFMTERDMLYFRLRWG